MIRLNRAEQKLAKFLGKERERNALSYPDLDIDCDEYLKHDAVLHDGTRVDVKSTKYPKGRLIVVPWKDVDAVDAYVLVVGTFPEYRVVGAMEGYRLMRSHRMKDLGHGKVFVANQDELKPIDEL
jgi:hypothetical protein